MKMTDCVDFINLAPQYALFQLQTVVWTEREPASSEANSVLSVVMFTRSGLLWQLVSLLLGRLDGKTFGHRLTQ